MSVKISGLPAAAAAASTDQHPVNQGGTTRRLTNAQIATFIQTALNLLTLAGGKLSLGNDGSVLASNGALTIDLNGNLTTNGFVNAGGGLIQLLASGAFFSANGLAGNDAAGNITGVSIDIGGGNANIASNGNTSLAQGAAAFQIDGSANLANGLVNLSAAGDVSAVSYTANGLAGNTGDYVILVAGVPKTFHFEGGILTSVT